MAKSPFTGGIPCKLACIIPIQLTTANCKICEFKQDCCDPGDVDEIQLGKTSGCSR